MENIASYRQDNSSNKSARRELFLRRKEVLCSDGEVVYRIDEPGVKLGISQLFDPHAERGGMEGSDGVLAEAVITTASGSVYYFDGGGLMINMKKDGTASLNDLYGLYEEHLERGGRPLDGKVTVGERFQMPGRLTSPVKTVTYAFLQRHSSDQQPTDDTPENPFKPFREALERYRQSHR